MLDGRREKCSCANMLSTVTRNVGSYDFSVSSLLRRQRASGRTRACFLALPGEEHYIYDESDTVRGGF